MAQQDRPTEQQKGRTEQALNPKMTFFGWLIIKVGQDVMLIIRGVTSREQMTDMTSFKFFMTINKKLAKIQ